MPAVDADVVMVHFVSNIEEQDDGTACFGQKWKERLRNVTEVVPPKAETHPS